MFNIFTRKPKEPTKLPLPKHKIPMPKVKIPKKDTVQVVIFRSENIISCKVFKEPEECLNFAKELDMESKYRNITVIRIEEYKLN